MECLRGRRDGERAVGVVQWEGKAEVACVLERQVAGRSVDRGFCVIHQGPPTVAHNFVMGLRCSSGIGYRIPCRDGLD